VAAAWGVPQWGMHGGAEWMAPPYGWDGYGAAAAAASGEAAAAAFMAAATAASRAATAAPAAPAAPGMVRLRGLPFTSTEQDRRAGVLRSERHRGARRRRPEGGLAAGAAERAAHRPGRGADAQPRGRRGRPAGAQRQVDGHPLHRGLSPRRRRLSAGHGPLRRRGQRHTGRFPGRCG
ncbi:unnamed protein product, partial [Prorocentrum cordatum]